MILTVDIGNTNVVAGGVAGEEPSFVDRLPSSREWDGTAWREALGELLRERGLTVDKIAGSALCSVVPELTERLRSALREVTRRPVRTVDAGLDVGLVLAGYDRRALGNDRVVDAVSCMQSGAIYGAAAQIDGLTARVERPGLSLLPASGVP